MFPQRLRDQSSGSTEIRLMPRPYILYRRDKEDYGFVQTALTIPGFILATPARWCAAIQGKSSAPRPLKGGQPRSLS